MSEKKQESIPQIIKRRRKEKGMSQEELAIKCYVKRTTIVNVEREIASPSLTLLQFIAIALDLELVLIEKEE